MSYLTQRESHIGKQIIWYVVVGCVFVFASIVGGCRPAQAAEINEALAVRAIIGEASNQGFDGMTAVAEAIRNRGTLRGVYGVRAKHVDLEPQWVWSRAREAWERSKSTNFVKGADMWENEKVFGKPNWDFSKLVFTATVGDHNFYREIK